MNTESIINYLISMNLPGIRERVYAETPVDKPDDEPDEYLIVEQTGSGDENHIENKMVVVQTISRDRNNGLSKVMAINENVIAAMKKMPEYADVFRCHLNTDYNFTDTSSKKYRWQAVFDITY